MKNITPQTIAPLANAFICNRALETALNRSPHLPSMVCFMGPPVTAKFSACPMQPQNTGLLRYPCAVPRLAGGLLQNILQEINLVFAAGI